MIHSFLAQLQDSFERLPAVSAWRSGRRMLHDHHHRLGARLGAEQIARRPLRTDVINFLLSTFTRPTAYLEIGVRNPHDNFAHVRADAKWGVDPGLEFQSNPVAFPMTSDAFFEAFAAGRCGKLPARFEVIFLDGLHYAEQVDRDIAHSLDALADDGFIVLHDCNPPTEWHARECFAYGLSPAATAWNGTAWKAFLKYRYRRDLQSCCIDTDWGVGVISRTAAIGAAPRVHNPFFEFGVLESNRRDLLNLLSFDDFVAAVSGGAEARPDATPATTPSRRQHQASGRAA